MVCFRVLTSIHDKMRTTHDISVRFFGIDWQHMFRISYNLGELVTEMAEFARERRPPQPWMEVPFSRGEGRFFSSKHGARSSFMKKGE